MSELTKTDLLDVDKQIAQQNFVCLSFVSPENEIKKREHWEFQQFLKNYELNKSMEKMNAFLNFLSFKYNLNMEKLTEDFKEFVETEKSSLVETMTDDFKNFTDQHEETLMKNYQEEYGFQTSTRGVKVRGTFATLEEAELRCKMLREVDPNHDIYCAPVGTWLPFHPEAYKTGDVRYLEEELNNLMHEKKKNEDKAKQEFDMRVKESKMKAIEENVERAKESNNVLTQSINEKGDLVSVNNVNSQEKVLGVNATAEEIKKELFEGENIVMEKSGSKKQN